MKSKVLGMAVALTLLGSALGAQAQFSGIALPTGFVTLSEIADAGDSWVAATNGKTYYFAADGAKASRCTTLTAPQRQMLQLAIERGWQVNLMVLGAGNNLSCIKGVILKAR